jgi:NAD(P)H-dependent FMN reductase
VFRIPVVVGSIRRGRNTIRLARLIARQLDAHPEVEGEIVDLAELEIPLLEERLHLLEDPPAGLVRFGASMRDADAIVFATPEYNKLVPAALKNAVDALGKELERKPIGIATHSVGDFGGTVVLQYVRPMIMNLGGVPIPANLSVPRISQNVAEDGTALNEVFDDRAARFVSELVEYAAVFAALRSRKA